MKRRHSYILIVILVLALICGSVSWFAESIFIRMAFPAIGLALIALGLGLNSFLIAEETNKRMNNIDATLTQIKDLQEEIQKEQKEQSEKKGSGSQIIPTLEVFSKFYLDYLNKQKGEDNK